MHLAEHIFKANDIRAIADLNLTDVVAERLGLAIGAYFRAHGETRAIVCQDVRESSPRIATAVCSALSKSGVDVIDIGTYATPICYFAGRHLGVSASVMITASHNPGEYNGMKITSGDTTIFGYEIQKIKELAFSDDALVASIPGKLERYEHIERDYVDYIASRVRLKRPLKVAIDAGNGAAGNTAIRLYEAMGCEVVPLYCDPNPAFPNHHPDPTMPENLAALAAAVKGKRCDVGLGFDGDGDRLGVVSDEGEIIWGDMLQILFWRRLLQKHPGQEAPIEVKCSQKLFDEVKRLGGRPFFHKTGHSFIKATMKEKKLLFAGEMSGHFFFADEYFGFDDALYAGARLFRLLSEESQPLSAMVGGLPTTYATPEIRRELPQEGRDALMERALARFKANGLDVLDVDGVRVNFPDGWGLLRLSNTQPIVVMRAEGNSVNAMERIEKELRSAVGELISGKASLF